MTIIRKLTYCSEIDFQLPDNYDSLSFLKESDGIIEIVPVSEEISEPNSTPTRGKEYANSLIQRANILIERERFWETHNVLEEAWHAMSEPLKTYFHGLTLIAVANVQAQTDREIIAKGTYTRALAKIIASGVDNNFAKSLPADFSYPLKVVIPLLHEI